MRRCVKVFSSVSYFRFSAINYGFITFILFVRNNFYTILEDLSCWFIGLYISSGISSVMASQERKRKNSAPMLTGNKVSKISAITKPCASMHDDSSGVDLVLSQSISCSQSINNNLLCGVCKQITSVDPIQVTSLQCCLCNTYYHGACLNVSNTSLLDFLYVVAEIGGWCCSTCRQPKPGKSGTGRVSKVTLNAEQVNEEPTADQSSVSFHIRLFKAQFE